MRRPLFLFLLLPTLITAQNRFSISGNITSESGEQLAFANVTLDRNNKYDVADENGKYSIENVRGGRYVITISSLGFRTITRTLEVTGNLSLDFAMVENV